MANIVRPLKSDPAAMFERKYPDQETAMEEICKRIEDIYCGLTCPICKRADLTRQFGMSRVHCQNCRKSFHLTTGTVFERMRRPKAWVIAIELLERGAIVNAHRLSAISGAAVSSCWVILKKLSFLLTEFNSNKMNSKNEFCVPSALFLVSFSKRSRKTPANGHPMDEQYEQEIEEEKMKIENKASIEELMSDVCDLDAQSIGLEPETISDMHFEGKRNLSDRRIEKDKEAVSITLDESERYIWESITAEPQSIDSLIDALSMKYGLTTGAVLSGLTMLELAGVVVRSSGEFYQRNFSKPVTDSKVSNVSANVMICIDQIIELFISEYHGISRKYLQQYLSLYSIVTNTCEWSLARLYYCCIHSPPVSIRKILEYNTALHVRF